MKRSDLIRHLLKNGCDLLREGSRHSIANLNHLRKTPIMKYTRIEIRAFITLPFHGMGIQAGVSTPADKKKIISTDQKGALYMERNIRLGNMSAVPRHNEIKELMVLKICKDLDIEKP